MSLLVYDPSGYCAHCGIRNMAGDWFACDAGEKPRCHRCHVGRLTNQQKKTGEVGGVQNPTVYWARAHGCRATKLQGVGNRSQPDYIFWIPGGRPKLIEFKKPGEVPTPLQAKTIRDYMDDGYDVEIHDSRVSAVASLKATMEATHE